LPEKDPFVEGVLECLPHLRGFAHLLARDHAHAEDLVQETVLRAISHRTQFRPGTSLRSWLIVILRNRYFSDRRRNIHRATLPLDVNVNEGSESGGQEETVQFKDFERHFKKLPDAQREALLLVGVNGYSYEEAAEITGRAIGTIKSRVSRARLLLQAALEEEPKNNSED
jgi:RNA polymerase sigma-70 factor (ECF subfamily)